MTATWVDGGYLLGTAEGVFRSSPASGWQGGVCFGLSLVLGGVFFAGRMRARGYTTLVDPFSERFGRAWAAVLAVPAVLGELFWSAELLVAVGASSAALLGVRFEVAVLVAAAVVLAYTMAGGLWSVTYADVLQLTLVVVGMCAGDPVRARGHGRPRRHLGGLPRLLSRLGRAGAATSPSARNGARASVTAWWDLSA